ncbi:GNAT family N-acetyltransferase [Streptomyces sp. NPDC004533]|uniref:GNAT family N-acetyltransferase n=1 Tax=Streptomyces sp. NPDC004533 TaxID=3154278 RepID=UPI0033AFE4AB
MAAYPAEHSGDPFASLTGQVFRPARQRPVRMRGVTEADLPELHRLDREVFQEVAYPYFMLRQLFDMYADHLLVLDDGEALQGYVLAGTGDDSGLGWMLGLGVARARRGEGLGRRLMLEILGRLRNDGIREVRLTVDPTNAAAIALYKSSGFAPATAEGGLRRNYFGPGEHRLVLGLSL